MHIPLYPVDFCLGEPASVGTRTAKKVYCPPEIDNKINKSKKEEKKKRKRKEEKRKKEEGMEDITQGGVFFTLWRFART